MFEAAHIVCSAKRRLFLQVSISGWITVVALSLSACVVPYSYGPYYQPVAPENSKHIWIAQHEGAAPANLRMAVSGKCMMGLRANSDDKSFAIFWSLENWAPKGGSEKCQIGVRENALAIEDLDTHQSKAVTVFRRTFVFGPGFDINQIVDLQSKIPGFASVPTSEKRYTLSASLSRKFKGPLPDTVSIQLPDIVIGDRATTPPLLQLKRQKKILGTDIYVPESGENVGAVTASAEFSYRRGGVYVWYEEGSRFRLAASFSGTPDSYDASGMIKVKGVSSIFGNIYIEVFGGLPVRLTAKHVDWHVPGDKQSMIIPLRKSKWQLQMYTTSSLSEQINFLPDYLKPGDIYSDDFSRSFAVVIPDYHPKRLRVTLPSVLLNGHAWPIPPLIFEYKTGGVSAGGL